MSEIKKLLAVSLLASNLVLAGPALDQAEVRLPYSELKALINGAVHTVAEPNPDPTLLAARFRVSMNGGKPEISASFRTTTFADGLAKIPLVGGSVTVGSQEPADARILIKDGMLCQALAKEGTQDIELKLLPSMGAEGSELIIPASPASIFETGQLGEDWSVGVTFDGAEQILGSDARIALPLTGCRLVFRVLGGAETREAMRPPEPSTWTWQHQALVVPGDGELTYRVMGNASASSGSGVSAELALPADAREVNVTGEDLIDQKLLRGTDRSLKLRIDWKTRGNLEREVAITYQLPRRPLDRIWKLQSPVAGDGKSTLTRFIVVGAPELTYAADGLLGPFPPKGLPTSLSEGLNGVSCYQLEAASSVDLSVTQLPVVKTDEATVSDALWLVKVEPDGAMLMDGEMTFEHRGAFGVALDIPPGMTLLSFTVDGQPATPVSLGEGMIEVSLPSDGSKTRVACSFTGKTPAIDPMEGTLELALPKTSLFIRTLVWKIDLPRGYQAETHGNLVRVTEPGDPSSRMSLRKNLCRDERPATKVFYQRSDLKN